jgi:hypothetical protein
MLRVAEKIEGFAIDAAGIGWVITNNSDETPFWSIGTLP